MHYLPATAPHVQRARLARILAPHRLPHRPKATGRPGLLERIPNRAPAAAGSESFHDAFILPQRAGICRGRASRPAIKHSLKNLTIRSFRLETFDSSRSDGCVGDFDGNEVRQVRQLIQRGIGDGGIR